MKKLQIFKQQYILSLIFTIFTGCVATNQTLDSTNSQPLPVPIGPGQGIDDLILVDCLLPGQIRQLGSQMTYLTPRRLVKSTKTDCGIRGGEFVLFDRSDYHNALAALLPKANSGDPISQSYVAEIYDKGLGLAEPNPTAAAEWYRKAAEQGYSPAQTHLGALYEQGRGVPQDKVQALEWYRRASGLNKDQLKFESDFKKEREDFQREIALRNQVADALRQKLKALATTPLVATPAPTPTSVSVQVKPRVAHSNSNPSKNQSRHPSAPVHQVAPAQTSKVHAERAQIVRQIESQRRDTESQAERVKKELHAIQQLRQTDTGFKRVVDVKKYAQSGKLDLPMHQSQAEASTRSAQLGKLELARTQEYQSLLDTSRRLSLAQAQ